MFCIFIHICIQRENFENPYAADCRSEVYGFHFCFTGFALKPERRATVVGMRCFYSSSGYLGKT